MEDRAGSSHGSVRKDGKHSRRQKDSNQHTKDYKHNTKQHETTKHFVPSAKQDFPVSTRPKKGEDQSIKGDYFVSDRKGDAGILQYGSNHSYQVPPYRRVGYGFVLGLSRFLKIDRDLSTSKEIQLVSSHFIGSKRDKAIFAKVAQATEFSIWQTQTTSKSELNEDYLTLENRKGHHTNSDSNESTDSDGPDYRSVIRKGKGNNALDKSHGEQGESHRALASDSLSNEMTWSRKVKLDPSDGQAWLELIKQQTPAPSTRPTGAERSSSAEIKISMYEKALKHVTGPVREDLLRGLLKEASFVWNEVKIERKWDEALHSYGYSFGLWKDYLDHQQTRFTQFRFDDLSMVYKDTLASIRSHQHGKDMETTGKAPESQSTNNVTSTHALYFLLRYTICLKQAGFVEQAIAIWQITLEIQSCSATSAKSKAAIEKFWDSEVPRIGELGAVGLVDYGENGGEAPFGQEDVPNPVNKSPRIQAWLEFETRVSTLLPARTLDFTYEEDTFRIVLFSDIQTFLMQEFDLSSENVIDAFLLFNGLPQIWQGETESWAMDPFVYQEDSTAGEMDHTTNMRHQWLRPGLSCRTSTDTLFASPKSPLCCFPRGPEKIDPASRHTTSRGFVRTVLKQLIDRKMDEPNQKLKEYYLAFELQYYPQDVKKTSKSYLKKNPRALSLYNVHALIEHRLGNAKAARKVLQTAIEMCAKESEVILLKRTLAWESLEGGQPSSALECLLEGCQTQDETAIFSTQQNLLSGMDIAAGSKQHLVISYMDCLLLIGYLTNPEPLSAALAIFQTNLSFIKLKLAGNQDTIELSHQSLARLLYYHMQNHQYKPSTIRKAIQQSITAFPSNTIFLSIFQLNEQRFRINDRVRSVVHDILSKRESSDNSRTSPAVTHVFAIHAEMSRSVSLESSTESIRSAFERAVGDEAIRSCSAIWYWYAEFELSRCSREKSSQRSQSVLFRAMTACPWVRDFYLMAIRCLEEMQNESQTQGVYEAIVERELRLRMPMEEKA